MENKRIKRFFKENATRDCNFKVPPSLFDKFQDKCKSRYKTISEVLRELMVKYLEEEGK